MTFGKNLRAAREKKGLTLNALAKQLGLSSGAVIMNWEHDNSRPSYDNLVRMCYILETDPNSLLEFNSQVIADFTYTDNDEQDECAIDYKATESAMLETFHSASHREKEIIANFIMSFDTSNNRMYSAVRPSGMFLVEQDNPELYKQIKSQIPILKKLKKSSFVSYTTLQTHLWDIGYTDICLAYIWGIFWGMSSRVPTQALYNSIESYFIKHGGKLD